MTDEARADDVVELAKKGGEARAKKLSAKRRSEIAKLAAETRWSGDLPQAEYGSPDRPLRLANVEIPCYVLSDGRRVLVQRGMMTALDMSQGTAGRGGGDRLSKFVGTKALKPYVNGELAEMITNPIRFRAGGAVAYGYEATVLAELCEAVLAARKAGALNYQQEHIAEQCEILIRGFARLGIIALVDEATGFQAVRARDALAEILKAFVQKELRKWVRTFPPEYYEELCRLRGVSYPPPGMKLPPYFGHLTNNIVYERLAPGVKDELKKVTERSASGRHKHKLFQHLTDDIGNPKLREHLGKVTALMKVAPDYTTFEAFLEKVVPRWDDTLPLPLDDRIAP